MSSLSRCTASRRAPRALPANDLFKVLVLMAVLFLFGLAHLHLRFSLNDLRAQTIRLQSVQGNLRSSINALRGETEALKHPDRLDAYATRELGMVPCDSRRRVSCQMPSEIYTRYAMARAAQDRAVASADRAAYTDSRWIEVLGDQVGLINKSMAATETKKK